MAFTMRLVLIATLFASLVSAQTPPAKPASPAVIRCAVIGGMTMTGLWQAVAKMFEAETGYQLELVVTGQRPVLDEALRAGKVDLLTMHSGDITTDLVADGFGINMRPWTRNELVIVGPPSDPARVRGMSDGAAALKKIADAHAHFVDFDGIGSRELTHTLWRLSGAEPKGDWVLRDDTVTKFDILQFARKNEAYVVVGFIPADTGKMPAQGMEILVKGDPVMRRPFIVMEANPQKAANVNAAGARALSDFLLSPRVQNFLLEFGREARGDEPLFFPVAAPESESLGQFRVFIQEHPKALDELKKDPSLIGKPEFAGTHDVVGDYLRQHPGIADEVKSVPHFFDDLTATTPGGQHRKRAEDKKEDKK
jgi:tungstate transport system substrate-binding protein